MVGLAAGLLLRRIGELEVNESGTVVRASTTAWAQLASDEGLLLIMIFQATDMGAESEADMSSLFMQENCSAAVPIAANLRLMRLADPA